MNALQRNPYTEAWRAIGAEIPPPRAILAISAHWYVPGTYLTAGARPRTIHDFGGFPSELFAFEYPAPGSPALAKRVVEAFRPITARLDDGGGLDHGTWSVLAHVFPDADIPVVQLSIDKTQGPRFHYELGKRLAPLRDEGVLIIGSGNVVHNLHAYAWGRHPAEPFDWGVRFERHIRGAVIAGDVESFVEYEEFGRDAMLSVPTREHYLPLLYVLGSRQEGDEVSFPIEGVDGGSISMLGIRLR